jgi:hypothetical protein
LGVTLATAWGNLGPFLESVRPWISPVALTAILGVVLTHRLGLRKLKVEADRVEIEDRAVHDKDEADIRDHYAQEVAALRGALQAASARHREETEGIVAKLRDCRASEDRLLDKVRELKDVVAGLIRIITQASASEAIRLGPAASAEIQAAARSVSLILVERREETQEPPSHANPS